jgi:hypothetical protein
MAHTTTHAELVTMTRDALLKTSPEKRATYRVEDDGKVVRLIVVSVGEPRGIPADDWLRGVSEP